MDTVSLTGSPCLEPYISSSSEVQITFTSNTGQGRFFATFQSNSSFYIGNIYHIDDKCFLKSY